MTRLILERSQNLTTDVLVALFDVDFTSLRGASGTDIYRFTTNITEDGLPLRWRGSEYTQVPIEADGFEITGSGRLPRPVLRISNVLGIAAAGVIEFGDLLGAVVTRWRTFRQFLDDGEGSDWDAHFPADVYRVERKSQHTNTLIEWELISLLDQEGSILPRRVYLKDLCLHRYRIWNGTAFDYSRATCDYTGNIYRNKRGQVVGASEDSCAKTIGECRERFGYYNPLSFGGFPGIARGRV